MNIIKELKKITFSKVYAANVIDLLYGISHIHLQYFGVYAGFVGILYIYALFPTKYKVYGDMTESFVKEIILNGNVSIITFVGIILIKGLDVMGIIFRSSLKKNCLYIFEIIIGTILLFSFIFRNSIINSDVILMAFASFIILKLCLKSITRALKISTRHFGTLDNRNTKV